MALFKRRNKKQQQDKVDSTHDNDIIDSDAVVSTEPMPGSEGSDIGTRRNSALVTGRRTKSVYDFSRMDTVINDIQSEKEAKNSKGSDSLDVSKLSRKERKALKDAMEGSITSYPHLMAMKPSEGFVFHSDYFQVDNYYGCVLAFFHDDSAQDHFSEFWGINQIPSGLDSDVTTALFSSVARMSEGWVDNHMQTVDRLDKLEENEQRQGGTMQTKRRTAKIASDMEQITAELHNGSSYLSVQQRLLVKAPTLDSLERNIERIRRLYVERFGTLSVTPYPGEQKQELSHLFAPNKIKRGKGFHFTSAEYAGAYSLVTNGLNDPTGEYVGYMVGDVNNSAVLFDVDDYIERVVCADNTISTAPTLNRPRVVDMWGSKISQAALLANHRVVHIVLNNAKLDEIGPKFERITSHVDMVSGDINMFEFFGDVEDELSLYSAQIQKISLMAEEVQPPTDEERSIIRGSLSHLLERFYTDKNMWVPNAKENRDRLRLVGLRHTDVPVLHDFQTYLDQEYESFVTKTSKDEDQQRATNKLKLLFKSMLENNGDLFDQHTSSHIDGVDASRRVVYDFANLRHRGQGVAMAQLVNVIGFAVRNLNYGDVLIIHGADRISDTVKDYMEMQIDQLTHRGGRVVYLYNSVEKMLDDRDFNDFVKADYTILGPMTSDIVPKYESTMNQSIPRDLQQLITATGRNQSYLRRKFTNVVFYTDLGLGLSSPASSVDATGGSTPGRKKVRKKVQPSATTRQRAADAVGENVPVASSHGVKMDESETEDGGVQLAPTQSTVPRQEPVAHDADVDVEEVVAEEESILVKHAPAQRRGLDVTS